MDNPAHERTWKAIIRLVQETRAPMKQFFLQKVGLSAHDVRVIVRTSQLYRVSKADPSRSRTLENEEYWWRFVQPVSLQILNQSHTEPVITEVHLFAELHNSPIQLSFFQGGSSTRSWRWTKNYLESTQKDEIFQLPSLKRGTVVAIDFDEKAWIEPNKDWLQPFLEKLRETKEARIDLGIKRERYAVYMARRENPALREQLDRNDQEQNEVANRLINKYEVLFDEEYRDDLLVKIDLGARKAIAALDDCSNFLESWVAVILDNKVSLPFWWDKERNEFVPGFFIGRSVSSAVRQCNNTTAAFKWRRIEVGPSQ
jgi:hypothetical protein